MKAGAEHRVPLSDAAVKILEQARMLDDEAGWCSFGPEAWALPF